MQLRPIPGDSPVSGGFHPVHQALGTSGITWEPARHGWTASTSRGTLPALPDVRLTRLTGRVILPDYTRTVSISRWDPAFCAVIWKLNRLMDGQGGIRTETGRVLSDTGSIRICSHKCQEKTIIHTTHVVHLSDKIRYLFIENVISQLGVPISRPRNRLPVISSLLMPP